MSANDALHWVRIAPDLLPAEGELREITLDGQQIALGRIDDHLHAFRARCPHASAPLAEGDLRSRYVICPLHAYRFDLRTGRCLKPRDGPRLRLFTVERRADGWWVALPSAYDARP